MKTIKVIDRDDAEGVLLNGAGQPLSVGKSPFELDLRQDLVASGNAINSAGEPMRVHLRWKGGDLVEDRAYLHARGVLPDVSEGA